MSKLKLLLFILFALFFGFYFQESSLAATSYSVNVVKSVEKVTRKDGFDITINIQNNGTTAIKNFEIRAPYYDKIADTTVMSVNPEFNKLLATNEYPAGFNNKSWLINSFEPGQSKTYVIKYSVVESPTIENGLSVKYTLPLTWQGTGSGTIGDEITTRDLQFELFLDAKFENTYSTTLPTFEAFDNEVSKIRLNEKYYFEGSKTTDLKEINKTNISAFPNFKLETQDVLIEWLEPINFSAEGTADIMKNLDEYLNPVWGKITFSAESVPFLAKKVNITFKNTPFISEPKIKINTEIKKLAEAKGSFQKDAKTVAVPLDSLASTSLYPNIETDPSSIETSEATATIKVKLDNPSAAISYTINNKDEKNVFNIDLRTGEFQIKIPDVSKTQEVEIKVKYKNDEEAKKIVPVKFKEAAVVPSKTTVTTPDLKDEGIAINPITMALMIAASALLIIIGGYIYYLYYSKHKKKNKEDKIDFKDLSINDSVLSKSKPQSPELNLNSVKNSDENRSKLSETDLEEKYALDTKEDVLDLRRGSKDMSSDSDKKDSFLSKEN